MSETRNDDGTFASSEGLYGREYEEAEAGYKPMVAPQPKDEEFSASDGAEYLSARDGAPEEPEQIVVIDRATGEPVNSDLSNGPVESLSVEQAAELLTNYHDGKAAIDTKTISADFAAEVDKMRADAVKEGLDPKSTGIDKATADVPAQDNSGDQPAGMEHLDPEVQKALKIPAVKQALEHEFEQAHQAKQQFGETLNAAQRLAQATLLELAPGLGNLQPHEIEPALQQLFQTDPGRAQAIVSTLDKAQRIEFAQQQQAAVHQQAMQQQIQQFKAEQDAAFAKMVPLSRVQQVEAAESIASYSEAIGVSRADLVATIQQNPIMNHAAFQRMMLDASRYHTLMQAPKARPGVPLPPVQRPGVSQPSVSDSSTKIQALERQFATAIASKQIKLAVEIQELRGKR